MRVLVTGGGRGIAQAPRALAGDGCDVVVGARSSEQAEAVADEIGGEWVQRDVADRGSVERAAAQAGEIDLLVANASVGDNHERRASWDIDPADCRAELVRRLATSRYDALAGRYLHAEHDDVDELLRRTDEVPERDLNTIRLRRNQGWSGAIASAVSMQRRVRIAF